MAAPALTTQFAYRTQKTIGLVNAFPEYDAVSGFQKPETNNRCCAYSPDGKWFAWACNEDVKIALADTGEVKNTLPAQSVYELGFSPQGSYIITWERPSKQEDGSATKNLKVWRTETAEHVVAFVQKSQTGWNLQYTHDEKYCARAVTNEVQFYEADKMNTVWGHLRVEGVSDFALSPGKNYSIAVFIPERKGNPAAVQIYNLPNWNTILSKKSFYKADRIQLKWNDLGTCLLVFAQTDADKTGKSYYGETNLFLISVVGNHDCRVELDKEGPIHDVTWSPNSKEFGVVYGFMPAKTTIFDNRARVVFQLPPGPRNTILFSPHARFVLVAGFGNLQGSTDIYDIQAGMRKICTIEASNASVCEWSPDGRYILTATTSPRLRVDNGVKIWHFTGGLMYTSELDELYNVIWRPQYVHLHPLPNPLPSAPQPHASALQHVSTTAPKKPAGAYRPPHARNTETPLHFKREDEGGAAHIYTNGSSGSGGMNGFGKGRRREVPGAAPAEKLVPGAAPGGGVSLVGTGAGADDKGKKTRRRTKKNKDEAPTGNANGQGEGIPRNPARDNQQPGIKSRKPNDQHSGASEFVTRPGSQKAAQQAPDTPTDDKKVRGLYKKLRAIEDLKERLDTGEKLEETQLKKITTEAQVRKELAALGL
ncbi:hypothetical protein RUND412_003300 [Rhizina undulata]